MIRFCVKTKMNMIVESHPESISGSHEVENEKLEQIQLGRELKRFFNKLKMAIK